MPSLRFGPLHGPRRVSKRRPIVQLAIDQELRLDALLADSAARIDKVPVVGGLHHREQRLALKQASALGG